MESLATIINNIPCHNMTLNASNKENIVCLTYYEKISKREYAKLLNQLTEWNVYAPKAIVKKYGVKTVQLAVDYTKATKNVRCYGAYFTYMVRQLKTQNVEQAENDLSEVKQEIDTNITNITNNINHGTGADVFRDSRSVCYNLISILDI